MVQGNSMVPTLKGNEVMILKKYDTSYERFDIVVVKAEGEYLIKRVIGLPGETIKYEDNKLYVNGVRIEDNHSSKLTADFEAEVPEGRYFVLGDNRTNSTDSRIIGAVKKSQIKGKTHFILFPFNRFGTKH